MLKDARKDFGDIGKECGLPRKTIWNHYCKMKEKGIIVGATIQWDYRSYGYTHVAGMVVTADPQITERKKAEIEKIKRRKAELNLFQSLPKNKWITVLWLKSLTEIEQMKENIRQALSATDIKTYIWTDIKNIPENLSFDLPDNIVEIDEINAKATNNSSKTHKLDEIDMQITEKLAENSRESFRKIAEEIGISTDTVARRYNRLKRNGALKSVIQFNPSKLGYKALFDVKLSYNSQTNSYEMLKQLTNIPDVICLCRINGDFDIHVWALIKDLKHFLLIQKMIVGNSAITKVDGTLTDIFVEKWPVPWQFMSTF